MRVGYKRVSSVEQNLARQDLGDVERIFEDKISGKDTNRAALQEMIGFVRSGDEVVVHSIDRLARDFVIFRTSSSNSMTKVLVFRFCRSVLLSLARLMMRCQS